MKNFKAFVEAFSHEFKVGDEVMADMGDGKVAYGKIYRFGEKFIHVKHNDGEILCYRPKHLEPADGYWDRERDKENKIRRKEARDEKQKAKQLSLDLGDE